VLEHGSPEWVKMLPSDVRLSTSIARMHEAVSAYEQRCRGCWRHLAQSSGDGVQSQICRLCQLYRVNGLGNRRMSQMCLYCAGRDHSIDGCVRVEVCSSLFGLNYLRSLTNEYRISVSRETTGGVKHSLRKFEVLLGPSRSGSALT
jgi:hypothetical protein